MNSANIDAESDTKLPYIWAIILLLIMGFFRYVSYPVVSNDFEVSISHWIDALNGSPGLTAFARPFSNYTPLYLYFLKILTYIPVNPLYTVKTLSLLFDLILGYIVACLLVRNISGKNYEKGLIIFIFVLIASIPTVILNSSLWAQCDSIYAVFTLLSLYFIFKDRPVAATMFFAVGISLKLQAAFFLPVLVGYLWSKDTRYLLYLFIIPLIFIVSIIPAWISGGSFTDLFMTYARQAGEFKELTLSAPSVYGLIDNLQISELISTILSYIGYVIGLAVASWLVILTRNILEADYYPRQLMFVSLLSVIIIPFFLPHMHERYFYLADIISVAYAFFDPRRRYIPVLVIAASFFSYMPFLSGSVSIFSKLIVNIWILAAVMCAAILFMVPTILRVVRAAKHQRLYEHE